MLMRRRSHILLAVLTLFLLFATGGPGLAQQQQQVSPIRDDAPFFSADAVKQAEAVIEQIRIVHQKDVRIETFPDIPKEFQGRFEQQGKARFFEQWVAERAAARRVDGVYVLVCESPRRVQVWVGNRTARTAFTVADRDELVRQLAEHFHQHQFDAGLLQGVRFIQRQMGRHSGAGDASVAVLWHGCPNTVNDPGPIFFIRQLGDHP